MPQLSASWTILCGRMTCASPSPIAERPGMRGDLIIVLYISQNLSKSMSNRLSSTSSTTLVQMAANCDVCCS